MSKVKETIMSNETFWSRFTELSKENARETEKLIRQAEDLIEVNKNLLEENGRLRRKIRLLEQRIEILQTAEERGDTYKRGPYDN